MLPSMSQQRSHLATPLVSSIPTSSLVTLHHSPQSPQILQQPSICSQTPTSSHNPLGCFGESPNPHLVSSLPGDFLSTEPHDISYSTAEALFGTQFSDSFSLKQPQLYPTQQCSSQDINSGNILGGSNLSLNSSSYVSTPSLITGSTIAPEDIFNRINTQSTFQCANFNTTSLHKYQWPYYTPNISSSIEYPSVTNPVTVKQELQCQTETYSVSNISESARTESVERISASSSSSITGPTSSHRESRL